MLGNEVLQPDEQPAADVAAVMPGRATMAPEIRQQGVHAEGPVSIAVSRPAGSTTKMAAV